MDPAMTINITKNSTCGIVGSSIKADLYRKIGTRGLFVFIGSFYYKMITLIQNAALCIHIHPYTHRFLIHSVFNT